jgi:hypothetical protein
MSSRIPFALHHMNPRPDDADKRYSYDPVKEDDYYDEAFDEFDASNKDGVPHIPTFAQHVLERVKEVGLLHRTDT